MVVVAAVAVAGRTAVIVTLSERRRGIHAVTWLDTARPA